MREGQGVRYGQRNIITVKRNQLSFFEQSIGSTVCFQKSRNFDGVADAK